MIVLALVLFGIAALIVLWLVLALGNSETIDLSGAGLDIHVNAITVFVLGVVTTLLVLLGLQFLYWGTKRGAKQRRERKDLQKQARAASRQRDAAIEERERATSTLGVRRDSQDPGDDSRVDDSRGGDSGGGDSRADDSRGGDSRVADSRADDSRGGDSRADDSRGGEEHRDRWRWGNEPRDDQR